MSVALVTLAEAKAGTRFDDNDAIDTAMELAIEAASEAVIEYLKDAADAFLDEDGEPIPELVPARVKDAVIVLVDYRVNGLGTDRDKEFEHGYLPRPVTSLLYPLRKPSLA